MAESSTVERKEAMKKTGLLALALVLVAALFLCPVAKADVLDPFDNMSAPPGTFGLGVYLSYQNLPDYETGGDTFDIGVDAWAMLLRPIWFGPKIAGKMSWGLNAVIPVASVSANDLDSQSGLGDIAISPFIFLYENEKSGLYISFWEFIYMPTGEYDQNNPDTSPGLDTWQFQHQLAVGWYPAPWGVDFTFNYWNRLESDKLNMDYQDFIETDIMLHYTFGGGLTLGVMGSFKWDTAELKADGEDIPDTKGHRYAAGLSVMYPITETIIMSGRWVHDLEVDNHTKGDWMYLRVLFLF